MKKHLRLSKATFRKAEKIKKDEMKNVKGTSMESECCQMFCSVCGDSIGELLYFLPTSSIDVPPC